MSFVSCSRDEDATMGVAIDDDAAEYVSMDIAIDDIEIFISEDYYQITPYIVIVLVHGFVPNNCEYPYETRHHWQGNNTAIIEIKNETGDRRFFQLLSERSSIPNSHLSR